MNSTKLFNFKYLWQNIKKSKSIIIFLMCAIPFINLWIVGLNSLNANFVLDFTGISNITAILSFFFPSLLAYILFGFVFKKKTVDFIMSQPITRKKIYVSNIFGGIIILLITVLITTLGFGLLSLFTKIYIPLGALIDYFIYWLITYIFVFLISSLAICFAGNMMSSLVVLLLLLFLFPTISYVNYTFKYLNNNAIYVCTDEECIPDREIYCLNSTDNCEVIDESRVNYYFYYNFTSNLSTPVNYWATSEFSTPSIIKTAILSLIYLVLGYYAFKYRKMEDSEVSFKNKYLYEIIKIATFIPVTFIAYTMSSDNSAYILISLVICLGYYFVYDLVLKRVIKDPVKLILKSIIVTALIFIIYIIANSVYANNTPVIESIDEVTVTYNDAKLGINQSISVTDEVLINKLIRGEDSVGMANYIVDIEIEDKYYTYRNVSKDTYNELINYAEENNLGEKFTTDNIVYVASLLDPSISVSLNEEFKEDLVEYINNYETPEDSDNLFISIYKYENHELKRIDLKINDNLNLLNHIKTSFNDHFIKNFDGDEIRIAGTDGTDNYEEENQVLNKNQDRLLEFLKEHKNDEIDGEYVILYYETERYITNRDVFLQSI